MLARSALSPYPAMSIPACLVVDLHFGAETAIEGFAELVFGQCPQKEPFRLFGPHVDAAMAHRRAKVAMPVGAMQSVSLVKIHNVRDIRQIISRARHGR